ncbi:hemerythrin domain-containing protein [Piscinibacter terrae]|uniref:Hemerythrin domain-containing protein n=1 Tax=Piscinibacter terrae TaxID=2496871 RepID=A0A3N7HPX9_9BURK|nr:hemerythrin domain-containing protein [Albitalea terrae]RQP22811.1 hemerythrin domain-containing protein [Albitalea terrae]
MSNKIVDSLAESHRALGGLADQLRRTVRPEDASRLFRQFALALGGHLGMMNKVVYPSLQNQDPDQREAQAALMLGHTRLAQSLADLLTLKPDSSAFADSLRDLLEASCETIAREEEVLFPMLGTLDDSQVLAMTLDADTYLAPLAEPEPDPADVKFSSDWLEEARLLLGTLPTATAPSA